MERRSIGNLVFGVPPAPGSLELSEAMTSMISRPNMNKHSVHSEVPLKRFHQLFVIAAIGGMISFGAGAAHATHSWGAYHWARTSNPFTVKLGTNVSSQ